MYGKRVAKDDIQVEAYGTIDELNASLGFARTTAIDPWVSDQLLAVQKDLVTLMGELCVADEDWDKYQTSPYPKFTKPMLDRLDEAVKTIESQSVSFEGWATPGDNLHSSALDLSRTVCRRAERRVFSLQQKKTKHKDEHLHYLNRLSDVLWLMARLSETTKI